MIKIGPLPHLKKPYQKVYNGHTYTNKLHRKSLRKIAKNKTNEKKKRIGNKSRKKTVKKHNKPKLE